MTTAVSLVLSWLLCSVGMLVCGAIFLLIGMIWYAACLKILAAMKESYWIAAWVWYKRGNTANAKNRLERAIRGDAMLAEEQNAKK